MFVADQNTAGSVTGDVMTEQQSNTPLPSGVPENVQVYLHNIHKTLTIYRTSYMYMMTHV